MSQNPARRSANLHTFDAAINFGQLVRDAAEEKACVVTAPPQGNTHFTADGLETLLAANDDLVMDFDCLLVTESGAAEPLASADEAVEQHGWVTQHAEAGILPVDLIAAMEAGARNDRTAPEFTDTAPAENTDNAHQPHVIVTGAAQAETTISLADIVTSMDPLNQALLLPPTAGPDAKTDAATPEMPGDRAVHDALDMLDTRNTHDTRSDALEERGMMAPFRAPAPEESLLADL